VPRRGPLEKELAKRAIDVRVMNIFGPAVRLGRYSRWGDYLRTIPSAPLSVVSLLKLARLINEEEIKLIHASGIKTHLLTCLLDPLVRARIIWHVHDFLRARSFADFFLLFAEVFPDLIIVNSHAVAEDFHGNRKVIVVHNGVDLDEFSPRREEAQRHDQLRVGMVGALAPWKGQDVFIRAAKTVSEHVKNVRFLIIGGEIYDTSGHEGYGEELKRLAASLGLQSQIVFTGFRRDIANIMTSLDVIVHCSVEPEPFGRVIVEAMACGKPVIAANAGGVPEIIEDETVGVLVPPGDVERLAEAMRLLLTNERRREALGRAARERAERLFRIENQVREIERLYESLAFS